VPEATVDKDYGPVFSENDIWLSGKIRMMEAESVALRKKRLPEAYFG